MKTKEELNALKNEVETMNRKLAELTEDELAQVSGGKYVRPCEYVPDLPDVEPEHSDRHPVRATGIS